MYTHKTIIHPRYSDMDTFGHVNNACYLTYFEEARVEFMNEIVGWKYNWSENGIIVARAEIDFIVPAHFTDPINVYTWCEKIGTKSFTLSYKLVKVENVSEVILANGISVLVMYDYKNNRSIEIPPEWKAALQ